MELDAIKLLILHELEVVTDKYDAVKDRTNPGYGESTANQAKARMHDIGTHHEAVYKIARALEIPGIKAHARSY